MSRNKLKSDNILCGRLEFCPLNFYIYNLFACLSELITLFIFRELSTSQSDFFRMLDEKINNVRTYYTNLLFIECLRKEYSTHFPGTRAQVLSF